MIDGLQRDRVLFSRWRALANTEELTTVGREYIISVVRILSLATIPAENVAGGIILLCRRSWLMVYVGPG